MKKLKNFTFFRVAVSGALVLLFLISTDALSQQQNLSGNGTSNYPRVKDARLKQHQTQPSFTNDNFKKFQKILPSEQKSGKTRTDFFSVLKQALAIDSLADSTNMLVYFGAGYYYDYYFDSIPVNIILPFYTEIYTDYFSDTADITVTYDFGDGTIESMHPYNYYPDSFYVESYFFSQAFHKYVLPGVYKPVCTVTSLIDTVTTLLYYDFYGDSMITISSDPAPLSYIEQFYSYSYQWCDSLNFNYSGTDNYLSLFSMNIQDVTDTFSIYLNFGDGYDTLITESFYDVIMYYPYYYWYWGGYYWPYLYFDITHNYLLPGNYTANCIVSFPDGIVDTASWQTSVGSSCSGISGNVFVDNNNNCIKDPGEAGIPEMYLITSYYYWDTLYWYDCYYDGWAVTDSSGNYSLYFPDNCSHTDSIFLYTDWNYYPVVNLPLSCPSSGYYVINTGVSSSGNDFAFGCQSGFDLKGFMYGWRFRPGFQGFLYPFFTNYQCDSINGTATLVFDEPGYLTIDSVVPPATTINGDTITWAFTNMSILDWWNFSTIYFTIDSTAQQDDTITVTLTLEPISGDNNPSDNIITEDFIVSNSWDPNEKEVFPKTKDSEGNITPDQELTYIIHFQNTGSDTAYNITVIDTLSDNLDLSDFRVVASSHYMQYSLTDHVLVFDFPLIMLPDSTVNNPASQGFVSYSIKPISNVPEGSHIYNTAQIYFDFNPAVVTNTTVNTIAVVTAVLNSPANDDIIVYPNPSTNYLTIETTQPSEIEIMNLQGQLMKQIFSNEEQISIDVSAFPVGMYFIKVKSENNISVKKFIKE
ncbi:MAG: T9SS type A sorting domain-containing protein [Bacteroidota bacterium]